MAARRRRLPRGRTAAVVPSGVVAGAERLLLFLLRPAELIRVDGFYRLLIAEEILRLQGNQPVGFLQQLLVHGFRNSHRGILGEIVGGVRLHGVPGRLAGRPDPSSAPGTRRAGLPENPPWPLFEHRAGWGSRALLPAARLPAPATS